MPTICFNCPDWHPQPCLCDKKRKEQARNAEINAIKQKEYTFRDYTYQSIQRVRRMA